jgi:hypothetical protein
MTLRKLAVIAPVGLVLALAGPVAAAHHVTATAKPSGLLGLSAPTN